MTEPTTTVSADRNADFTYELDITSDVMDALIRRGRTSEASQPAPGMCILKVDNSAGAYTPLGATTPLRPMHGIQLVADSQNLFTGFVQRVQLHPSAKKQEMIVRCSDWLWVLSRKDISLPLYLDVRSDILAHRIVDLAEIGEHIDNPRFKTDTTGWSAIATGTIARDTSQPILEGPASLKVTTAAAADGARYTIPHDADSDFQSVKVTASCYVRNDGGTEGNVILRVADSGGNRAASSATTLSGEWQRMTVDGTFNGAATDFYIDIEQDGAGSRTFRVGAVHCVTFINACPRSFNAGQSRFSHIAPHRTKALRALQDVANNELGGLVYVNGSGTLVFEDRAYRWRTATSTSSQGTIDETMVDLPYEEDAEDLIGEVELGYAKWEEGTAGSTVFQLFPVPRSIGPSGTLTIDGDYGAIVRDFTAPVANTDYYIRSQPDSDFAGDDETGNVTVTFEDFGGGFKATFTNTVARTVHLTSYKVRATPVRIASDQPKETYTPSGAPNFASKLKYSYRLASSQPAVKAYAEYLGDRYVTQRSRLPVRLRNKTAGILTEMTDRVISERVTITNDNTAYSSKVNAAHYIDSVQHHLSQGKTAMETIWGVVPTDTTYWILGTGELDDATETSVTTRLAP
jgi:hypothetical protein